MSLINDALKKAQRDRTGGPSPETPIPGGGSRPAESLRETAPKTPNWLWLAGGAALGLALALGGIFFLRSPGTETKPAEPATVASTPPGTPPAADSAASNATAQPAPPPGANSRDSAALAIAPPAAALEAAPPASAVPEPVPAATITVQVASPAESARDLQKLAEFVDALRVMGIRASGTDSKVLMNDRVYRIGDTVDHALGVKLTGATATSLTFVDATGASYTRNF